MSPSNINENVERRGRKKVNKFLCPVVLKVFSQKIIKNFHTKTKDAQKGLECIVLYLPASKTTLLSYTGSAAYTHLSLLLIIPGIYIHPILLDPKTYN